MNALNEKADHKYFLRYKFLARICERACGNPACAHSYSMLL